METAIQTHAALEVRFVEWAKAEDRASWSTSRPTEPCRDQAGCGHDRAGPCAWRGRLCPLPGGLPLASALTISGARFGLEWGAAHEARPPRGVLAHKEDR